MYSPINCMRIVKLVILRMKARIIFSAVLQLTCAHSIVIQNKRVGTRTRGSSIIPHSPYRCPSLEALRSSNFPEIRQNCN